MATFGLEILLYQIGNTITISKASDNNLQKNHLIVPGLFQNIPYAIYLISQGLGDNFF